MVTLIGTICAHGVRETIPACVPLMVGYQITYKVGHSVTEEAPIYGLFINSLFVLNRVRHF